MTRPLAAMLMTGALIAPAHAQEVWAVANTVSHHLGTSQCGDNERNFGLGAEARFEHDLSAAAGFYRNTCRNTSTYAYVAWQPLALGPVSAGAFVGGVTRYPAYDLRPGPAAGAIVTVADADVGLNLLYVPRQGEKNSAVIALQLKARLR